MECIASVNLIVMRLVIENKQLIYIAKSKVSCRKKLGLDCLNVCWVLSLCARNNKDNSQFDILYGLPQINIPYMITKYIQHKSSFSS